MNRVLYLTNLHPRITYVHWSLTFFLITFIFRDYKKNLRTNLPYLLYVQYQIQTEWKRPQDFQQRFVFQSQGENLYLLLLLITENKKQIVNCHYTFPRKFVEVVMSDSFYGAVGPYHKSPCPMTVICKVPPNFNHYLTICIFNVEGLQWSPAPEHIQLKNMYCHY